MLDIKSKFEKGKKNNSFIRVDEKHKLDIFVGYSREGKATMTILEFGDKQKIESSKFIDVSLFKQNDGKISLSFILKNNDMYSIFIKFCEDIIESSRNITNTEIIDFIIYRWSNWKNIFKNMKNNTLTENQVIGLIGELIFINDYMIPKYGEDEAIIAWQGTEMLHKDFEIFDTWYEIKTKINTTQTVSISSIEQLDSELEGSLVIIKLQKTNILNEKSINLNFYVKYLEANIKSYNNNLKFIEKLTKIGYWYNDNYNSWNYKFDKMNVYKVKDDFPRLRRAKLDNGIISAKYDINIENIKRFQDKEVYTNEFTRV